MQDILISTARRQKIDNFITWNKVLGNIQVSVGRRAKKIQNVSRYLENPVESVRPDETAIKKKISHYTWENVGTINR